MKLRPYQEAAISALRISLAGGNKRLMLYSPTGSGKTEMAMSIISGAVAKGKRVVFLCNRIHLVGQASKRFYRSGINHGIIQGDNTRHVDSQVIVASIQTVARRGMPDCDLIVIDEAHSVAGSRDFRSVIISRNNVPVIGLSATPFSKGLGKWYQELGGELFESMTVATSIAELIRDKYLVDCDIYAPSEPDMSGCKMQRNAYGEHDWSDRDVARESDKPKLVGDIVDHWLRLSYGLPTVCFASSIPHSKHIVDAFNGRGVSAEHIDCYTSEEDRAEILHRVETGETLIISNVGILTEGWDFPACRTMILARPTKSLIRYIQMIGRVLRPHETKTRALVLDHSGTVSRLGFPTDDLPMELDDGKPKDAKKDAKKDDALPKPCPKCHFVKPPKTPLCPQCGFKPERKSDTEHEDGELQLVTRNASMPDKQDFYSQVLHIARIKGYSDGWAAHAYREKFGVWPRRLDHSTKEPTAETRAWITHRNIKRAKSKSRVEQMREYLGVKNAA